MAIELKELVIRGFLGSKPKEGEDKMKDINCTASPEDNKLKAQIDQLKKQFQDKNER